MTFLLLKRRGVINSKLGMGVDTSSVKSLLSNSSITTVGVQLSGTGFIVSDDSDVEAMGGESRENERVIKKYVNGKDLTQKPRGVRVIDLFGLSENEAKKRFPSAYQWVLERVKPVRMQNPRKAYRDKWWIFAEPRPEWRKMSSGLGFYISTVRTSKHRLFFIVDSEILPDAKLVNIASDDKVLLGVASSRIHVAWSFSLGANLGVGNDPTYNHSQCFTTFPFPVLGFSAATKIRDIAEQIDAHRKRQQAAHPSLTLTGMYNVLEKLRAGEELIDKDKTINQQGLVSTLLEDHDQLDRAVFEAYGWQDLADKLVGRPGATTPLPNKPADQAEAEEELLMRLVTLNKQRAAEEAQGKVRWLRPDYQAPDATQDDAELATDQVEAPKAVAATKSKATFPKSMPEQIRVLREALADRPHTTESMAELFKRKPRKSVEEGLQSLVAAGIAQYEEDSGTWYAAG